MVRDDEVAAWAAGTGRQGRRAPHQARGSHQAWGSHQARGSHQAWGIWFRLHHAARHGEPARRASPRCHIFAKRKLDVAVTRARGATSRRAWAGLPIATAATPRCSPPRRGRALRPRVGHQAGPTAHRGESRPDAHAHHYPQRDGPGRSPLRPSALSLLTPKTVSHTSLCAHPAPSAVPRAASPAPPATSPPSLGRGLPASPCRAAGRPRRAGSRVVPAATRR